MYKVFLLIIALCIPFSSTFADFSLSPLKYEMIVDPGSTQTQLMTIRNDSDEALTLYSQVEDFIAGDDSGFPQFIKPEDIENPELSLANWISLSNENITLAPGESKQVSFNVTAPATADPGGHYGVIFFGPEAQPGAQLSVIQRLGILLLVTIPGEVVIGWEFQALEVWNMEADNFVAQDSFQAFPIAFSSLFENTGNTHLKPQGKITLSDENGNTLTQVGKEKIISQAGAVVWEKVVDYIPVNETLWNVLPGSKRRFISDWEWFGYNLINEETWEKEVAFKGLSEYYKDQVASSQQFIKFYQSVKTRTVTKPITANYDLYFEWKDKSINEFNTSQVFSVTYLETYIGLNTIMMLIILIWLSGGGYYFGVIKPKQKSQSEAQLREKIMKEMKK